ncbi:hypothetical protein A6A04_15850 [Paramagnetospirillum marisnigri]|uniref:DUF115 domain-containing protein n=1 Tax=Paramagnetospirillum marisnigri TaxID=1285242 RepID=A0A178MSZ3_9PROT|nr:6-hydroxymethylpterin diphosphokinase MptE-like protein [Paramagnetospirillum marisnigri]OAN52770.1 hypothetical protein A6A04_15850 [Paramagnetospirillum marisnigri]
MKPYQNRERFQENLKQLGKLDAPLARLLERTPTTTRLVIDHQGEFNIDVGGGFLYPDNARAAAMRQVDEYLPQPFRLSVPPGVVQDSCVELNRVVRAMAEEVAPLARAPARASFGGALVVFGVGLGHHLKLLAERLDFKQMIVVEQHDELIVHALHAFNWKGLIQDLSRQGRQLHILRGTEVYPRLVDLLRGPWFPFLDGSHVFFHYQTPDFTAIGQKLLMDGRDLATMGGWVEDQLVMMRNNTANFRRPPFHLQRRRVTAARSLPAMVVGAGPSLDACLDDIKRCRQDMVLISASTALKVLLNNGLRPDIHCELENDPTLADVIATHAERHGGLKDISLYTTPTVDPRIPSHFGRVAYFYRNHLNSTEFYARGAESTAFADPTSGNTAVYCALSLGFREVYLFGLDFGARDPRHHHSRHSVYYTYEDEAELSTWVPYDFNLTVPGNFGGEVLTGWTLNWGRNSVTNAIRGVGAVRVMNCSDGSFIPGTTPLASSELKPGPAAMPQRQDIDQALADLTFCPESLVNPDDFKRFGDTAGDFIAACRGHVEAMTPVGGPPQAVMRGVCERIIADLTRLEQSNRAVYGTLVGHINEMLAAAHHHASLLDPVDGVGGLEVLGRCLAEGFTRLESVVAVALETV